MSRAISVLLLFGSFLLPGRVLAQKSAQPLTNKDVVEMAQGGLPETTIINAIKAQDTKFDVSAAALIQLKQQGVSTNIINAMLAAVHRQSQNDARPTPTQDSDRPGLPAPALGSGPDKAPSPATTNEILGAWQGVYFLYPQAMRIDLELRKASSPTGESIEGEFRFETLVREQRNLSGAFQGSYKISGQYDLSSRAFALNPGEWIQRPNQPAYGLHMTGVFDQRAGTLAGTFSNPGAPNAPALYFVLARPDRASQMLLEPMKRVWEDAQPNRPRRGLGGFNIGGGFGRPLGAGGEDIHKIAKWASRIVSEYPNVNLQNTAAAAVPAQNLFEDRYFTGNFGKTFDRMDEGDRHKIAQGLRSYLGEKQDEKAELRRKYALLQRYFEGFDVPRVFLGVLAHRSLRSWRQDTLERLRSLSPDRALESFSSVEAMDKAAEQNLAQLWPSERASVDKEMDVARSRFAGPALRASAEQMIQSADGYEGAVALASWESQQQWILKWADSSEKQQSMDLVHSKLDELLAPMMSQEWKRFESFGRGQNAVSKGATWMVDFNRRYSRFVSRPPVSATLSLAQRRREQDLAESQPAIAKEIEAQKSAEDLDRVVASYLLPEDSRTTAGFALAGHARERREILVRESKVAEARRHRAAVLGKRESDLSSLLKRKGPPSGDVEPTEEEMYDALQARVDAINEGTKQTLDACDARGYQNDPILAMQCLVLYGAGAGKRPDRLLEITKFRKVGTCIALEGGGYMCRYIGAISVNVPLPPSLQQLMRSGEMIQAEFIPFEKGWLLVTDQ